MANNKDPQVYLKLHRYQAGDIRFLQPASLRASRALDGVLLALPTEITLEADKNAKGSRPLLVGITADVTWKGMFVGRAVDTSIYFDGQLGSPGHLTVPVGSTAVWAIERSRDGQDVTFDLEVSAEVTELLTLADAKLLPGVQEGSVAGAGTKAGRTVEVRSLPLPISRHPVQVQYPAAAWAEMLRMTGLGENVVVEIPLPPAPPPPWDEVWTSVRTARDALARGGSTGWREVVTECRNALDKWDRVEGPKVRQAKPELRTPEQRADHVRQDLHRYAHSFVHNTALAATREDAVLVLSGLAALLAKRNP